MLRRGWITLTIILSLVLFGPIFSPLAAEGEGEKQPAAVTLADPQIPVDELALILKPLTKEELLVEADAWQQILKRKAKEIAETELAIKHQNKEIEKAQENKEKAQASTQEEEKQPSAANEQASGDTPEKTNEDADTGGDQDAGEKATEAKEEEKVALVESLTLLREERTVIIDRLSAVLDELESKTAEDDADTLKMINDYRLYIDGVRGIEVDVKDTTSALIAIKGWLMSEEGGLRWAKNIGIFLGIIVVAWLLSKLFSRGVRRGLRAMNNVSQLLEDFLVNAVRWVVMAVGIIMALAALEVSIGPLLAIVGAAGFVIAFALQDSLSNFASGLMILFFKPFDVGDVIEAGGVAGSVISMNLVSTSIKTFDNKQMVVPNNKIWNDVITNATGVETRRIDMEFGIGYTDDIDKAHAIIEEIVTSHPKVLEDPAPVVRVHTLGDSSVNFVCRPWSRTEDYWGVYWDVTETVKKTFDAKGVGIPFPQRDVHLYVKDGASKEDLGSLSIKRSVTEDATPQPLELDRENDDEPGS
jgi:small conductance mechanosensitive channel